MDKPGRPGKKLEVILREALEEISLGKTDLFHRVVAEVLEEIPISVKRADDNAEKKDAKPAGLTSITGND
jgi:hypothetical protein